MFSLNRVASSNKDEVPTGEFAINRYLEAQDPTGYEEIALSDDMNEEAINERKIDARGTEEPDDPSECEDEEPSEYSRYQAFIKQTPAWNWLVKSLQREAILIRADPDLMEEIKTKIRDALPASHKVTRRTPSQTYEMIFVLEWNPLAFVEEQRYSENPDEALERAITLTGSLNNAQALTVKQYLSQTWPTTGEQMMGLISDAVRNSHRRHATCEYQYPSIFAGI